MIAFAGHVVWACLAGIIVALVVAAAVVAIVRVARPSAATRCLLWSIALLACAAAPLAIVGGMLVHGVAVPSSAAGPVASHPATTAGGDALDTSPPLPASTHSLRSAPAALHAIAGATRTLRTPPTLSERPALALAGIWLAGALAGLIGLGRSLARVHALKRRSSPLEGALADAFPWLTEMPGREIYLRLSYEIETPISVGFRWPVILIPTDMATADGLPAIESLVMHEYAHLEHYDDWTNLIQRLIERLVWFNPLVWYVGRRIALEREVAADDAVVARTNDAPRYASTLWRMAREMRMPEHVVVAPGAMLTRKQISIRIERLLDESRARHLQAGSALVALVVGACTVTAVAATAPPIVFASAPAAAAPAVAHDVTPAIAVASPEPVPCPPPIPPAPAAPPAAAPAPALGSLADLPRRLADASATTAAALRTAVALVPRAVPPGDVTREVVASCRSCDFHGRDLSGLDLSGLTIVGASFDGANLSHADLSGTRLIGVSLRNTNLGGVDFSDAQIIGSHLDGADFKETDFSNARFIGTQFDGNGRHVNGALRTMLENCEGCNFANADLHGANFRGAKLAGVNFSDANLDGADLRDADLSGANLSGASMDGTLTTNANLSGAVLP